MTSDQTLPPTRSRASSTSTSRPRSASSQAAASPAKPAPMTIVRLTRRDGGTPVPSTRARWPLSGHAEGCERRLRLAWRPGRDRALAPLAVDDDVDALVEERDPVADLGRLAQRLAIGPGDVVLAG